LRSARKQYRTRTAPFSAFVACHFCLLSAGALETEERFEKLLVIAGRNEVRVEGSFRDQAGAGEVDFTAKIVPAKAGRTVWEGTLGRSAADSHGVVSISNVIPRLQAESWSPVSPALYHLEVSARRDGQTVATKRVRFGFRTMEIRNGQFHLNGRPIFLRGVAINPPGRGIPNEVAESRKFAEDYVRFLKSQNVNIFRISTDESQVWFDVCDEQGMMLYAGRYGSPPDADAGKRAAPADFARSIDGYRRLFERCASHPSIVVYYLANELPVSGQRGAAFSKFITQACAELKQWDPTRAYIGNAGYGEGREGDVCDVHRYWGWYYNSFLTYYNLRDKLLAKPLFGNAAMNQPLTFSECVGSFTGSSGEFNLVRSKQLAPALGWVGHTETPREDALNYQSFMVKQACESFRRMRPQNPRLAGLMPFTILFYNWSGISAFEQMKAKPAMDAMRTAYQPVLLSWELWTSQVYAGNEVRPVAHVINDDDRQGELRGATLEFSLQAKAGREYTVGRITLPPIPFYQAWSKSIPLKLLDDLPTGEYLLTGRVQVDGYTCSTNSTELFVAGRAWKSGGPRAELPLFVYDPGGGTAAALEKQGIPFERIADLNAWPERMKVLVIGERALNNMLSLHRERLQLFVRGGGRVLCLQQDPASFDLDWLPENISFCKNSPNDADYPPRTRPFREQMNINLERPDHPVFDGLNRRRFSLWSDYSGWDQTRPGFPKVYPVTTGFELEKPEALARTAILADYDRGLEGIALCEMFEGKGSVILSGFDLLNRSGLDPVADRLLVNLVAYTASGKIHELHPLIEKPIRWGDYPTERGVVCGSLNGLLVNAEWIPNQANPSAQSLPPNTGAWNMLPGEQFVPRGRNPFGRYSYSTAASLQDASPGSKSGEGFFWVRLAPGKKFMVTTVKNPFESAGTLRVFVNEQEKSVQRIEAGQTVKARTPLASEGGDVCVRYAGEKSLVLLETVFE
jgi:beta-galactosidase